MPGLRRSCESSVRVVVHELGELLIADGQRGSERFAALQPYQSGGPAGAGPSRDVGIDVEAVEGFGAGHSAELAAEGEARRVRRERAWLGMFGDEDDIAGGTRRDQLVGATVGQVFAAGLLAKDFVRAGLGVEVEGLVFADRFPGGVFGDEPEVVDAAVKPGQFLVDGLHFLGGGKGFPGDRNFGPIFGGRPVFEPVGGLQRFGIHLPVELGAGGGDFRGVDAFERRLAGGQRGAVGAEALPFSVDGGEAIVVGLTRGKPRNFSEDALGPENRSRLGAGDRWFAIGEGGPHST